jgi:hypothetical protein
MDRTSNVSCCSRKIELIGRCRECPQFEVVAESLYGHRNFYCSREIGTSPETC